MGSVEQVVLHLPTLMVLGLIVGVPVWAVLGWLRDRRAPNLLLENSTRCLDCQYDLGGLAPRGACPECGRPYDLARRSR